MQAFNLLARKVHPLALGNVKRATSQSQMMGEKLLNLRPGDEFDSHELTEIIEKLTSQLYFHGHPINRTEAREDVRLSFVDDATEQEAEAMWNLYLAYQEDMHLLEPFDLIHELSARGQLPDVPALNLQAGAQPNIATVDLGGDFRLAYIESEHRADVSKANLEVTAQRDVLGKFQANVISTSGGWEEE